MALIFSGKSKCPLCNEIMYDYEDIVLFPPFVQNMKDPYYIFNDNGVHKKCLTASPLGARAMEYRDIVFYKTRPENRICDIGGNLITSMDDYIFTDLLTSDAKEDLHQFNFMTIDKNNLNKWVQRENFLITARKFLSDDKWKSLTKFNYLDYLIKVIES